MDPSATNIMTGHVVQSVFEIYSELGFGMFETVYRTVLFKVLIDLGYTVRREVKVPITYRGITLKRGFRADLLVNETLIVEVKSIETITDKHYKQVLTYLRLSGYPLGLLTNFGARWLKGQIRRVVNGFDGPRPRDEVPVPIELW